MDVSPTATDPAPVLTYEQQLAAAKELIAKHEIAGDPNSRNADGSKASWLLQDGVMGQGEKPTWFKSEKYKTVAEQAKAYPELEKRLGTFVGAPKDGKYEFVPAESLAALGNTSELFNMQHPLMEDFTKWAVENQLSQEGYNQLLNRFLQHEVSIEQRRQPNWVDIKGRIGPDADSRINNVVQWAKANLGAEGVESFKAATRGANADAVFKVLEAVVAKTAQFKLPGPGVDAPAPRAGQGLEAIQAKLGEKLPDGRRKADVDPSYRAQVEREMSEYFANMPPGFQYQGTANTSFSRR